MIRILDHHAARSLITRKEARLAEAEQVVAPILAAIRARGDAAVLEYARKFDNFSGDLRVPASRMRKRPRSPVARISSGGRDRIEKHSRLRQPSSFLATCRSNIPTAAVLAMIVRPLDSMGAYIPAGRYPLPSTLLMTVIPAQVAGVPRIAVACPRPSDEILGICTLLNVSEVYRVGGAQAIAAFAYGTESIPRVERIVGPGNIYVAAAKKLVAGETGIDFIAGPTEIVIIAAEGDPKHIAADMLAQAEHDTDASSILITTSRNPWPKLSRRKSIASFPRFPPRRSPVKPSPRTAPLSWWKISIRPPKSRTRSRRSI